MENRYIECLQMGVVTQSVLSICENFSGRHIVTAAYDRVFIKPTVLGSVFIRPCTGDGAGVV